MHYQLRKWKEREGKMASQSTGSTEDKEIHDWMALVRSHGPDGGLQNKWCDHLQYQQGIYTNFASCEIAKRAWPMEIVG